MSKSFDLNFADITKGGYCLVVKGVDNYEDAVSKTSNDDAKVSCLIRIATALETMAKKHVEPDEDDKYDQRYYADGAARAKATVAYLRSKLGDDLPTIRHIFFGNAPSDSDDFHKVCEAIDWHKYPLRGDINNYIGLLVSCEDLPDILDEDVLERLRASLRKFGIVLHCDLPDE